MATVRIYKVAELLGSTSQEVLALLKRDHGIELKSASSTIEEVVARSFTERVARQRGPQVIDQMTDEILIRQEAEKRGITVSAEEIDNYFKETFGFFPDGTATPTITPTEFVFPTLSSEQLTIYPSTATPTEAPTSTAVTGTPDRSVTPTATATTAPPTPTFVPEQATASPTPYTLEGYQTDYDEMLKSFDTYNVSERTIRSIYEADLLRKKLRDDITKDIPQTEGQVWARHILVETEEEANAAYERLQDGEDFGKVAREVSKDTGSAANAGDLGWQPRSFYVKEFGDAAFTQEIGEIGSSLNACDNVGRCGCRW